LENLKGRALGRPGRGWEDNITMEIREIVRVVLDWMHLTKDRDRWRALVNTNETPDSINAGNFLTS
jgi:hypothetical protein